MNDINRKLAEWAGFKWNEVAFKQGWLQPDGEFMDSSFDFPDFTSSLDACFKWLVPKLEGLEDIVFGCNKDSWTALIACRTEGVWNIGNAIAETPALALCKAIERLLNE